MESDINKYANILANISELEIDEATKTLSTLVAIGVLKTSEDMFNFIDSLNEFTNNYPFTIKGIINSAKVLNC